MRFGQDQTFLCDLGLKALRRLFITNMALPHAGTPAGEMRKPR
ncbi:MAG TPA: hypothetical protein VKB96_11715 [Gammaproteobacteria bacterium]|nr:hypothetical protein [Gammaproteobacteria bacterium]